MESETLDGSVVFSFASSLFPGNGDPANYILNVDGEITLWVGDEDTPNEHAGKVKLAVVQLAEAQRNDVELFHVLDYYEIEALYPMLFKEDGVFWPHLDVEAPYGDLLIIEDIQLEPRFDDGLRHQAVETAIASFASVGIVLIKKQLLRLGPIESLERGYRDLEFQNYLLRDNVRLNT